MVECYRPRVSIGIPVFNGERFIDEAIQSTLSQTFKELELVISDNASTDGTEAICRRFLMQDPRVRYVRSPVNRGMAWNYARVLELAQGKYFKWLAHDDRYDTCFLAKCLEVLENDPTVVLTCTRTVFIDEAGRSLKQNDPGWDLRSAAAQERLAAVILNGGHWANADALSGLIRTDALRRTRSIPSYQGGDKCPLGELSLVGKFLEIPEYLLYRRVHDGASNVNNPAFRGYDRGSVRWMTEFFKGSMWHVCLPTWNLAIDHLLTIWRSRLGAKAKISLVGIIVKAGWWQRRFLLEELRVASRMLINTSLGKGL